MTTITVYGLDGKLDYVAPSTYDIGNGIAIRIGEPFYEKVNQYSYAIITCSEWTHPIEWYTLESGGFIKTAMDIDNMPQSANAVHFELEETARAYYG